MVNNKLFYNLYIQDIDVNIKNFTLINNDLLKKIEQIYDFLIPYKTFFDTKSNITLADIKKETNLKFLKYIKFNEGELYNKGIIVNKNILLVYIKKYIQLNSEIIINNEKIKQYNKQKINYKYYNIILREANEEARRIIINNEVFMFNNIFGNFALIKAKAKKIVDWEQSFKNKFKIETNGNIPYSMKDRMKADEDGVEYKGERWIQCFTDDYPFVNWFKNKKLFEYSKGLKKIHFKPSRGIKGIDFNTEIKKLSKDKNFMNTLTRSFKAKEYYKT